MIKSMILLHSLGQTFLSNKNISVVVNETNFLYELRDNKERRKDNEKFKHKQEKPSGFDSLCHQDPSCPVNCNVCCMLPYHTKTGNFFAIKLMNVTALAVTFRFRRKRAKGF